MKDKWDLITSDFTYVRWLGDRKGIEEKKTTWDKVIIDREDDLSESVRLLKNVQERPKL